MGEALRIVREIGVRFGCSESRQDFRSGSVPETVGEFRYHSISSNDVSSTFADFSADFGHDN